ncbi:glucose-1-phosphate adenylyltransferase subunit GlgD [Ruminococcus sp.]|uniref:glucose-1-phosphate adenylyltransferase subunit GlgD n=1 Tax=Ruminococcus sp. TaxID=41978 RepID=UPI00388EA9E2
MASNKILGVIFANTNEKHLPELTAYRTTGSVPFGGKYRMIDFPLSNMSNSGINNVGIVAKSNFMSLMDHVGSGSAWDLARRRSGMSILPPYGEHSFATLVETIFNLHGYIEHGDEEYVLIAPSDCVHNMDYSKLLHFAEKNYSDITFVYTKRVVKEITDDFRCILDVDETGKVTKIMASPVDDSVCCLDIGVILMKKTVLMALVRQAMSESKYSFVRDVLQKSLDRHRVYAYEFTGYCEIIGSVKEYYDANMMIMDRDTRYRLFDYRRPIYTKVRDDAPSRYGLNCDVKNSLIAQGCVINGSVENSIISKGVYIGHDAVIRNCIIMQDCIIGDKAELTNLVIDKDVNVSRGSKLQGTRNYPMYIAKRSIV